MKVSCTKSTATPSLDSAFALSSERITAIASNNTEGVPASYPLIDSIEPSASFAPTFGATIFTVAPASIKSSIVFII